MLMLLNGGGSGSRKTNNHTNNNNKHNTNSNTNNNGQRNNCNRQQNLNHKTQLPTTATGADLQSLLNLAPPHMQQQAAAAAVAAATFAASLGAFSGSSNNQPSGTISTTGRNTLPTQTQARALIKTASKYIYNKPRNHYELMQQRFQMQQEFAHLLTSVAASSAAAAAAQQQTQQKQQQKRVLSVTEEESVNFGSFTGSNSRSVQIAAAAAKNSFSSLLPYSNWFF